MPGFFAWTSQTLALWIVLQTYQSLRNALRGNPNALFISAGASAVVSVVVALAIAKLDIGVSFYNFLITSFIAGPIFIFRGEKKDFSK